MINMFIDVQCLIKDCTWSIIGYEFTYPWINENWRQRILLKLRTRFICFIYSFLKIYNSLQYNLPVCLVLSLGDISPTIQTPLRPTPDLTDPLMALTQLQSLSCQSHGWLPWSKWSRCDLNCQQQRQRFCRPECTDIRDCPGGSKEVQNCQTTCRREYISCIKM